MKTQAKDMTKGHPGRLLLQFALPLMLGNIFQQTYTMVDTAVVGQLVGVHALAALGSVDWFNWMSLGICSGLKAIFDEHFFINAYSTRLAIYTLLFSNLCQFRVLFS